MPDQYLFRREDNSEIVEVSFLEMMEQHAGYITLPDGVQAKRCTALETAPRPPPAAALGIDKPIISDSLGFSDYQLADFERDRVQHGFSDVEFVRDAQVPTFYQVKFKSRAEHARYIRHRGMLDNNGIFGGSAGLSPKQLSDAEQAMKEKYGA